MSDTDVNTDYSNVIHGMFGTESAGNVAANIDINPDDSARAYALEKATGVPASIIAGDLPTFERNTKATVANTIVSNNMYINDFVQRHPLNSQIFNDSYGQLDTLSDGLAGLGKSFREGFGDQPLNTKKFYTGFGSDEEFAKTLDMTGGNHLATAAYGVLGQGIGLAEVGFEGLSRSISGAIHASHDVLEKVGGKQLADDVAGMVEYSMVRGDIGVKAGGGGAEGPMNVLAKVKPWLYSDKLPPAGIHPEIDKVKTEANQSALELLDQKVTEAQGVPGRERAPELLRDFVNQHTQDATMGISGEAVIKLYGDKLPSADDGILGWVPNLKEQLDVARETGADITVPMADWITKVDPEVHKALHDDLRVVQGGITTREATELAAQPPPIPTVDETIPVVRAAGGYEPMFALGDRKLTIQRMIDKDRMKNTERNAQINWEIGEPGARWSELSSEEQQAATAKEYDRLQEVWANFHDFDLINEKGESVGTLNLSEQKGGKDLYVEMINGLGEYYNPNHFGPALMRDLKAQIKAEFPNAEYLTGHRVSGAREKAGKEMTSLAQVRIKLAEADTDPAIIHNQMSDLVGGAWLETYPGVEAYLKPTELFNAKEADISSAVDAELARLLPNRSFISAPVGDIRRPVVNVNPQGFFQAYPGKLPVIAYSLNADSPLGVARHESIHALRQMGLFHPAEWRALEKAAVDEKWLQKYGIEGRYSTLPRGKQLEEGIAEAFRHWMREKSLREGTPRTLVDQIFEKLENFLASIKEAIGKVLGREPTFDDLFSRIDRGEIAERGGHAQVGEPPSFAQAPDDYYIKGKPPEPANTNVSQAQVKAMLPEPLSRRERDWQNYGKHMSPDDVLGSEVVWSAAALGQESGLGRAEEFAAAANDLWKRMGANRYITPELAERYMRVEEAKAKGIGPAPSFAEPPLEKGTGTEVLPPFRAAKDIGMTVKDYNNYMKLIEARQKADLAQSSRRVLAEQTKRQTAEWKANAEAMRLDVVKDLNARPDIAADKFLANAELHGAKLENSYKLDRESMTKEQAAVLPNEYLTGRMGVKADDVAHLFGYPTGDSMIAGLARLNETRKATGLGRDRFMRHLIDVEIARRMEVEHGFLEKNILEEAKDQILSNNQLDLLHQETYHLARLAGTSFGEITRDQLVTQAKAKFDALPMRAIDSEKWFKEAGKHGKNAESSLLAGKPADAFRAKQAQYFNTIYAQMAKEVEKQRTKLDKAAKPFRKTDVKGVEPEYLNHIQNLLAQMGYKVGRSLENIEENLTRRQATLEEFADGKLSESFGYRDIPIADVIVDGKLTAVDDLTTHDFLGAKQTVDALIKNARDEQKIIRAGEAADRAAVLTEMRDHIERFPLQPMNATKTRWDKLKDLPKTFLASVTNMETFLNRMGDRDPQSVFNKYITYPAAAAANRKSALQREYARKYQAIGEIEDKDKKIVAPFNDPTTGRPFINFTRGNVATMLQNAGNRSNWEVLAKGYGADPIALMDWLVANTKKTDWERAQKLGKDVFNGLVKLADQEYEHIHGITIDKIPLEPINNIHGNYEGWYHPLIKHPDIEGKSPIRDGAYDDGDFGHITTSNGYTRKRSGAAYPLDLNPDMTPVRIGQMIHDISFRSFVLETQKLFKDPGLSNTITGHYGAEYNGRNFLIPWLKDIAGQESIPSRAAAKGRQISEFLRQNVISTYIGFNPFTAFKHGPTALVMSSKQVGPMNFLRATQDLYARSPSLTQANHEFVMQWSEELQRRERHWQDTIFGAHSEIEGAKGIRENIIQSGSWLVAKSDMFSAKPTWLAAYRSAQEEGLNHGERIDQADAAVRLAHGSTAVTNQPGLVRGGGALHAWLTSVYGFFGTVMQRRIELAQDIHDTWGLAKQGQISAMAKNLPGIAGDVFAYVIWPTLVEEWVTGLTTDDKRGWLEHAATASLLGLSSSVLYLRDVVHGILSGQDVGVGLISSPLHDVVKAAKDLGRKDAFTKARMGKTMGDTLTAFGHGTGMAPKTIDNAIRFGIDLVNQQAHPKSVGDVLRGVTKGTTQPREEK